MKVLVIGDSPSNKGGNSQSLKRLNDWMNYLGIQYYSFTNVSWLKTEMLPHVYYDAIISLGVTADEYVRPIKHFPLPHPSGLNRQTNDKQYIKECLDSCKKYLEDSNDLF